MKKTRPWDGGAQEMERWAPEVDAREVEHERPVTPRDVKSVPWTTRARLWIRETVVKPLVRHPRALLWLALSAFFSTAVQVLLPVILQAHAPRFPYLLFLLAGSGAAFVSFVLVWVRGWFHAGRSSDGGHVNVEQGHGSGSGLFSGATGAKNVSHWYLMMFGLLSAVNGVGLLFSAPKVPAMMQSLLGAPVVSVPMVIIASYVFLHRRYSIMELFAAVAIMVGVLIALIPTLRGQSTDSGRPEWDAIWAAGTVPVVAGSVLQERLFDTKHVDVWWMTAWVNAWQVAFILAAAPLSFAPLVGSTSVAGFWHYMHEGARCMVGLDIDPTVCPECHCRDTGILLAALIVAYSGAYVSQLALVREGSATLMNMVSTLVLPLSLILFAMPPVVISHAVHQAFTPYSGGALAIVLVGLVWFRVAEELRKERDMSADVERARLIRNVQEQP